MFGTPGHEDGELYRPSGVAVDAHGDIYVCDWGNNRVQLFAAGRTPSSRSSSATRPCRGPTLKGCSRRTAKLRRMRETAAYEPEKFFARPRSVRVDQHGHMFVPDYEHYRIQIYKKEAYVMDGGRNGPHPSASRRSTICRPFPVSQSVYTREEEHLASPSL